MKTVLTAGAIAVGLALGSAGVALAGNLPAGVTQISGEVVNTSGTSSVSGTQPVDGYTLLNLGTASSSGYQSGPGAGAVGDSALNIAINNTPGSNLLSGYYAGSTLYVASNPFSASGASQEYLSAEPNGSIVLTFSTTQTDFSLLWGSVDAYNTITFGCTQASAQCSSASVTGMDIQNAISGITANLGGAASTPPTDALVNIGLSQGFNTITFTSTSPAFEFVPDPTMDTQMSTVPEPGTLALLGAGLLGLGAAMIRRRRKAVKSV